MTVSSSQKKAQKNYEKKYSHITIRVSPDARTQINNYVSNSKYQSVNAFIISIIEKELNTTLK